MGATAGSDDHDSPWKEVLEVYFEAFMNLFFPDAHRGIDWSQPHEFLDKELQQVTPDAEHGRRTVDKLVRVQLRGGDEAWVLVHVEVQAQRDRSFPDRMLRDGVRRGLEVRFGEKGLSLISEVEVIHDEALLIQIQDALFRGLNLEEIRKIWQG